MTQEAPTKKLPRLAALDVSRGLLILTSIVTVAVLEPRPDQLIHSRWEGITFYDVIFPVFVALSGCGMAFAYRRRVRWRTTLWRAAMLFLVGAGYNWILQQPDTLHDLRLTGPLQVYTALLVFTHVLHLVLGARWWTWATFTLAFAGVWAGFWMWAASHCTESAVSVECNPTVPFEASWLGWGHIYRQGERGFEPEGLIGILGALVTCAAGTTAGHLLLRWRRKPAAPLMLTGWTLVVIGAGFALERLVPFMKWMWTPSYGLVTAAGAVALLAFTTLLLDTGREILDRPPLRLRLCEPLVALGRNALLMYFGSHAVMGLLLRHGEPTWAEQIASAIDVLGQHQVSFVLVTVVVWWALAAVLHRFRIYVKP